MGVGFANDIALHFHVLHDEVGTIEPVCHNASHESCRQNDGIGLFLIEELPHGIGICQIQFRMGLAHEIVISPLLEILPDGRADKSAVSCHIDFTIRV